MKKLYKKGALHTHSFASDGTGFPEEVVLAHKRKGYDFVAITDHNVMNSDDNLWLLVLRPEQGPFQGNLPYVGGCSYLEAVVRYKELCPGAVELKKNHSNTYVRVKTLDEVAALYDKKDEFLLLKGEEISHWFADPRGGRRQLHMNVINLEEAILQEPSCSIAESLSEARKSADAQFAAQAETGLFICNHPHGYWFDLEPQLLIDEYKVRFFELVNSNVDGVGGAGSLDFKLPRNNEMFWDMVNAHRAVKQQPLLLAVGSDDAHNYAPGEVDKRVGAGFAWVMVKVEDEFNRRNLMQAMLDGDFYTSTGVEFENIAFDASRGTLSVKVKSAENCNCRIRFVVSKKNFDRDFVYEEFALPERKIFRKLALPGSGIGVEGKVVEGIEGEYTLQDDDLYVRAVVESSEVFSCRSNRTFEYKSAWTQPFMKN